MEKLETQQLFPTIAQIAIVRQVQDVRAKIEGCYAPIECSNCGNLYVWAKCKNCWK